MAYFLMVVAILLLLLPDILKLDGKVKNLSKIEKIKTSDDGMCKYYLQGSSEPVYDSCGKFNIGDTIKFTK